MMRRQPRRHYCGRGGIGWRDGTFTLVGVTARVGSGSRAASWGLFDRTIHAASSAYRRLSDCRIVSSSSSEESKSMARMYIAQKLKKQK
jgi:hypothetical protein